MASVARGPVRGQRMASVAWGPGHGSVALKAGDHDSGDKKKRKGRVLSLVALNHPPLKE